MLYLLRVDMGMKPQLEMVLKSQQSCMCPPPTSPAHFPVCLIFLQRIIVWRAQDSCAADLTDRGKPASSGAKTQAHGRSSSLWMLRECIMSLGLRILTLALTSWVVMALS